jgi:N6-adenosine-specific RNA methylase IME4
MKIDPKMIALLPFELRAEIVENVERKDFSPSEIAAIWKRCEAAAREAAAQRQGSGKVSPRGVNGRARDNVAKLAGTSGRTLEKIVAVVDAAAEEPGRYGELLEKLDRTGRVNGVFRQLKVQRQAEAIRRERPPIPNGPHRVIVADPPWAARVRIDDPSRRGTSPYPTMSVEQICALPVRSIAHDDSILWLWTTNGDMRNAFTVLDSWGFEQKTILTWVKDRMGTGEWLRGQTEHCLMATRGRPIVHLTNQTTVLHAPAGRHSEKPDEFYKLVERLSPAPQYCELFARRQRIGWDCHGDEVMTPQEARP